MTEQVVTALISYFILDYLFGRFIGKRTNKVMQENFGISPGHSSWKVVFPICYGFFLACWWTIINFLIILAIRTHLSGFWAACESSAHIFMRDIFGSAKFLELALIYIVISVVLVILGKLTLHNESEQVIRGRELDNYRDVSKKARKAIKRAKDQAYVEWGGCQVPMENSTRHFCVVGATGSGKSITIRLLMEGALRQIKSRKDTRAIIYDAKRDIIPVLCGMGFNEEILLLNPFDKRSVAWDIAKDITGPAAAQQMASIIISTEHHSAQPFFADAARHLLTGVIISFIRQEVRWTLRDVLLTMRSKERLKSVLSRSDETKDLLEYFQNEKSINDILTTAQTKLQAFEYIAAAWDKAEDSISLKEWLNDGGILVLGNDEAARTALDAINQVIFKRASELLLSETESESRRTWVILDEVREAGRLDGLSRLLTTGRSKGVSVVLGFQDIEGMREVYGSKVANELIGQCGHKAILRLESPETAEWASRLFGSKEVLEKRETEGTTQQDLFGSSTRSKSTSEQLSIKQVVLPSEFMQIPSTNPTNGLTGYYITPASSYRVTYTAGFIGSSLSPAAEIPSVEFRPEEDQYLKPWTDADLLRLGLGKDQREEPVRQEGSLLAGIGGRGRN